MVQQYAINLVFVSFGTTGVKIWINQWPYGRMAGNAGGLPSFIARPQHRYHPAIPNLGYLGPPVGSILRVTPRCKFVQIVDACRKN